MLRYNGPRILCFCLQRTMFIAVVYYSALLLVSIIEQLVCLYSLSNRGTMVSFLFLPPRGKCIPVIASIFAIVRISFYFALIGLYELIPRVGITFPAKCSVERCFGPLWAILYIRAFTNKSRHVICIVVRIILGRFVSIGLCALIL